LVSNYESKLSDEYSIILVSTEKLKDVDIIEVVDEFKSLTEITPESVLRKFENQFSSSNYALLKVSLPNFYQLSLDKFPSNSRLKTIETNLYRLPYIKRVETFIKSHNQIYKLLIILEYISEFFGISVFIISILLIIKQVEVWKFEHIERMNIMALFGAPLWMRSAILFRLAVTDSIISAIIVSGSFYLFLKDNTLKEFLIDIEMSALSFDFTSDVAILMFISLTTTLISVVLTIAKHEEEQ
jgi:cell division transport system permease protein